MMLFFRRVWIHLFVHRNPNAKCPACGNKDGEIRWVPEFTFDSQEQPTTGAVIHRCKICTAMWGEHALVAKKHWHVNIDPHSFETPPS